jgi:hypothetical protein
MRMAVFVDEGWWIAKATEETRKIKKKGLKVWDSGGLRTDYFEKIGLSATTIKHY